MILISRTTQLPEIRNYFPNVQIKIIEGGHNIGLVDNRALFMQEVVGFIDGSQN